MRYADDLVVMCRDRAGSRARPCGVAGDPRRAGAHAQGRQDADRGAARRRGGAGLSRLPSPLGARQHARSRGISASSPAGPHVRRCSTPATGSVSSRTAAAAAAGRRSRAGPQPVPARLGGVLPLRKLRRPLRQDHAPRGRTAWRGSSPSVTSATGGYGWWVSPCQSPDRMGLINLNGTIVAPRPNRPWRRDAECRR